MKMLYFIKDMFNSPYKVVLSHKNENNNKPALIIVIITALFASFYRGNMDWSSAISVSFSLNFCLYFAACLAFKLAAVVNNKEVTFNEILSTWGFSYLPTVSFIAYIIITHVFFMNTKIGLSTPISIVLLDFIIAILIWKVIFYFIELKVVLKLNLIEMILASIVIGSVFVVCYMITGIVFGTKIPIV